jgi:hypothetical protein
MGFLPGITSSGSETRNPPEEYDSASINQLMDADQQDQNVQKILKAVTI